MKSLTREIYGEHVDGGVLAQSWWRTDRSAAGLRRRIEEDHLPYELVSGPEGLALRRL